MRPLSHTTYGLDLHLLSMLGTATCALHVCDFLALFGAHAQTIASRVPIANFRASFQQSLPCLPWV